MSERTEDQKIAEAIANGNEARANMNYKPVAPDDLEALVTKLNRLKAQTELPWVFDKEAGLFHVEHDGEKMYIEFTGEDAETELVETLTKGLPLLLRAIHNRFYFMNLK